MNDREKKIKEVYDFLEEQEKDFISDFLHPFMKGIEKDLKCDHIKRITRKVDGDMVEFNVAYCPLCGEKL